MRTVCDRGQSRIDSDGRDFEQLTFNMLPLIDVIPITRYPKMDLGLIAIANQFRNPTGPLNRCELASVRTGLAIDARYYNLPHD